MREVMNTQNAQMANEMGFNRGWTPMTLTVAISLSPSAGSSHEAWKCQVLMTSHIGREGNFSKFPSKMVLNKSSMCQENAEMHYRGLHQVCLPWHTREHCRHRECANQVEWNKYLVMAFGCHLDRIGAILKLCWRFDLRSRDVCWKTELQLSWSSVRPLTQGMVSRLAASGWKMMTITTIFVILVPPWHPLRASIVSFVEGFWRMILLASPWCS